MQASTLSAFRALDSGFINLEGLREACARCILAEIDKAPSRGDFDTLRDLIVGELAKSYDGDTGTPRKRWHDAVHFAVAQYGFVIPAEAPKSETAEAKRKAAQREAAQKTLMSKTPAQWAAEAKTAHKTAKTAAQIKAAGELAKKAEQAGKAQVAANKALARAAKTAVKDAVSDVTPHKAEAVQWALKLSKSDFALCQWAMMNKADVTALMKELTAARIEAAPEAQRLAA